MGETKTKALNGKSVLKFISDHAIIFLIILLALITWANSQNFMSRDNVGNLISKDDACIRLREAGRNGA